MEFGGRCLGAVWELGTSLLSAAGKIVALPFRWGAGLMTHWTGLPLFALPIAALLGLALVFLVLVLTGRFLIRWNERKR